VHRMSAGRIAINVMAAGAVVGAFQVQDAVAEGVLDIAHTVPAYWYGKHKGASLFGTGPAWGGDGANFLSWFHVGGGRELYRELTQDILGLNVVGFLCFPMPAQPLGWFKSEITSADQMKGMKYRTIGLAADLFEAMGVNVTIVPGGEVVPSMERGLIDGFEFNNPTSDMRLGAQDVAEFYMLGSYHQTTEVHEIIFNKERFEELDPDLQAILEYAVEAASTANFALALDQYSKDYKTLQTEYHIEMRRTPDALLAAQLAAWDQLIPRLEENEFMKRVLDSQREWTKRTVLYQQMTEPDYRVAYSHFFPA